MGPAWAVHRVGPLVAFFVGAGAAEDQVFLGARRGDVEDAQLFGETLAVQAVCDEHGSERRVADAFGFVDGGQAEAARRCR